MVPRILLVENERPHIDLIRSAFEAWPHPFRLSAVRTLREARRFLCDHAPDLVIADLDLPDGRGIDLLSEAPDQDVVPIVILTAQRDEWAAVEAMKAGAVDYVVKCHETLEDVPRIADRALREWRLIRERKLAERALRDSEALSRATLEHVLDGVLTMDEAGIIRSVNPSVMRIFGYDPPAMQGRHFDTLLAEPLGERASAAGLTREITGLRRDGTTFPLEIGLSRVQLDRRDLLIATLRDRTKSKRVEQHLTYLAEYDQLTALPNRVRFTNRLAHALRRVGNRPVGVALLLIDLDGFKMVNDTLGHQAGDALLSQVAARLKMALRDGDTVARLGGDEFAIVLDELERPEDAAEVARKILRLVADPYRIEASEAFVTASIGIAVHRAAGDDGKLLMREADLALYRAKGEGRNAFCFFTPDMHSLVQERQQLGTSLRHALDEDALQLYYQPIVDLESRRIVAVEALLRWQHPSLGLITPDRFVPIAEENGLIVPIGNWVLEQACLQGDAWRRQQLLPPSGISVNLSTRQFLKQNADELLQLCRRHHRQLKTTPLTFEITESLLLHDLTFVTSLLQRLKRLGIKVMIDDFGTGFSSLSYLANLPVDGLKIDRAFLHKLRDGNNAALTRAIIAMGQSLNLEVVAEGLQTQHQLAQLSSMGCSMAQGFLFGEPAPAEAVTAMLRDQPFCRRPASYRRPAKEDGLGLAGTEALSA